MKQARQTQKDKQYMFFSHMQSLYFKHICVCMCVGGWVYICIHGASKEVERGISEDNGGRKINIIYLYDIQIRIFMSICEIYDIYLYTLYTL